MFAQAYESRYSNTSGNLVTQIWSTGEEKERTSLSLKKFIVFFSFKIDPSSCSIDVCSMVLSVVLVIILVALWGRYR